MKSRTGIAIVLSLALLLTFGVGCSASGQNQAAAATQPAPAQNSALPASSDTASPAATSDDSKPVTLTLTLGTLEDYKQQVWWDYIFDPFKEKHPNVTIDFQCVNDLNNTVRVQVAAGAGPDTFETDCFDVLAMAQENRILPLENYRKQWKMDDTLFDWALSCDEFNGQLYAIPSIVETSCMTYNADLMKKLGLEPPKTREDFVKNSDAALQAGIIPVSYGYAGSACVFWIYDKYLGLYSGNRALEQLFTGKIKFSDPSIRGAFEVMKKDWDANYINDKQSPSISIEDSRNIFLQQKSLMNMEGSWWTVGDFTPGTFSFDWEQCPWPSMKDGTPALVGLSLGGNMCINAKSDCPDYCVELLMSFYQDPQRLANAVSKGLSTPPVDIDDSLFPADMDKDLIKALKIQTDMLNTDNDELYYTAWTFYPPKTGTQIDTTIEQMLFNQISMDDFLDGCQKALDEDLSNGFNFNGIYVK